MTKGYLQDLLDVLAVGMAASLSISPGIGRSFSFPKELRMPNIKYVSIKPTISIENSKIKKKEREFKGQSDSSR